MSVLVVDASVAAKWYLKEEHTELALRLLDGSQRLHAPDFVLLEMDNILCKHIRRGSVTPSDADDIRSALRRCEIRCMPFDLLRDRAYELAVETRTSVYDCLYAALAEALGARMVTADRRFFERMSATPFAELVMWVEDVGAAEAAPKRRDAKGKRRKGG